MNLGLSDLGAARPRARFQPRPGARRPSPRPFAMAPRRRPLAHRPIRGRAQAPAWYLRDEYDPRPYSGGIPLGAYDYADLGKFSFKRIGAALKRAVTPSARVRSFVRTATHAASTRLRAAVTAPKTEAGKRRLGKLLKGAAIVAGGAALVAGGFMFAPALIAKLGGAKGVGFAAAALKKLNAKRRERGEPEVTPEQLEANPSLLREVQETAATMTAPEAVAPVAGAISPDLAPAAEFVEDVFRAEAPARAVGAAPGAVPAEAEAEASMAAAPAEAPKAGGIPKPVLYGGAALLIAAVAYSVMRRRARAA
jgi:hypothetical protein